MNIDEAIKQLQECKKQGADRVVVCSSDRHLGGNLLEIELSQAYPDKPGDAVINGEFTNPFSKEEYEALVRIIDFAGGHISLSDEPLIVDLRKKMQARVVFYEEQESDDDDNDGEIASQL